MDNKKIARELLKIAKSLCADEMVGKYRIKMHPTEKLWYVLGRAGKFWMPVSSGYKDKMEAIKYAKKLPAADADAKRSISDI